jgi:LysR family cys regulon transcriptional activator
VNLQRLEILEAVIRCEFNVSRAAAELRQSQPGVSKQLQVLEEELGFPLFKRAGRRLIGLTDLGLEAHRIAQRMLRDRDALRDITSDFQRTEQGTLTIATTHTQARYALPRAIQTFMTRFPRVQLALHQGSPAQACIEAATGQADLAIATEAVSEDQGLVVLPCYEWNRSLIAPRGHPILETPELTLADIADYPIVTYAFAFSGRSQINAAFTSKGLRPNVVLTAIDADIIKTYVALGLGVGIVASMAVDEAVDHGLGVRDASHLFPPSTTSIGIRPGANLKGYVYSFIEIFAPHVTQEVVERALFS